MQLNEKRKRIRRDRSGMKQVCSGGFFWKLFVAILGAVGYTNVNHI